MYNRLYGFLKSNNHLLSSIWISTKTMYFPCIDLPYRRNYRTSWQIKLFFVDYLLTFRKVSIHLIMLSSFEKWFTMVLQIQLIISFLYILKMVYTLLVFLIIHQIFTLLCSILLAHSALPQGSICHILSI